MTRMQWPRVVILISVCFLPIICCFTVPVHLLYFTVAPGFNTMVLLFYSAIVYSRYDRFCFTMLFTYCVFLVVINCSLHPLLYILETIHTCLIFHALRKTKTLPEDGTYVPKHVGAALVINILTKLSVQCSFLCTT
jgi:hypothetical protein